MEPVNIAIYDLGDRGSRYVNALAKSGAKAVPFKYIDGARDAAGAADCCAGLLLPGGGDISPALYGRPLRSWCGEINEMRDQAEYALLRAFADAKKPIMGICRGIQVINAFFGGTLYQDILKETSSDIDHYHDCDYDQTAHAVSIAEGTPIYPLLGAENGVNSIHHQAVDGVAPGFTVAAAAPDGVVEAIWREAPSPVLGIQWHPERLCETRPEQQQIFDFFVGLCRQ